MPVRNLGVGGGGSMKGVMSSISLQVITSDSCITLKKSRLNLTSMYHNLHLKYDYIFWICKSDYELIKISQTREWLSSKKWPKFTKFAKVSVREVK